MTLKRYLIIMSLATAVCWGAWVFILYTVNPFETNWIGFVLFYLALFLSLTGAAALIGFFIRFVILKHKLAFRAVKEAFRQSFLFAFVMAASLLLLSQGLFTWLNLGLLIVGLTVLEFFLLSYTKS